MDRESLCTQKIKQVMGPSIKTTESSMDAADSGGDLVSGTLID